MAELEPFQKIEIDIDYCSKRYGEIVPPFGGADFSHVQGDTVESSSFDLSASVVVFVNDVVFNSSPSGVIWEQGAFLSGAYIGVTSGELVFRYGDGEYPTTDDCVRLTTPITPFLNKTLTLVGVIDLPKTATLYVLEGGVPIATLTGDSVNDISSWSGANNGGIGLKISTIVEGEDDTNFNDSIGSADFYQANTLINSCSASLGSTGVRKCYNTYATCQAKADFDKDIKTLQFITPSASLPKSGGPYFPALDSVSAFSSSVNIGGANPKMSSLGKRGKVKVNLTDFIYHDRFLDKYQRERVSGDAQTDEGGYDPSTRGSFFSKLKSRFPYYAGRPLRVIDGYLDGGVIAEQQTRHYIITEVTGPNDNRNVSIEAKDILTLADEKNSIAPYTSRGELLEEISDSATELELYPVGIGAEYPEEGYAAIGSEVVSYTRVDDIVTLTGRGLFNTQQSSHSEGDTFQEAIVFENQYVHDVINTLLGYTSISPDFIPYDEWETEVMRWASTLKLNTVIVEPTPVSELLEELAILGFAIFWCEVCQEIKIRATKPVDLGQTVYKLNDDEHIKSITQIDRDEDRITQIHFYTVQTDPTQDPSNRKSYDRIQVTIDPDAQGENAYNDTKIRRILCRWLNFGADTAIKIRSKRLLTRFSTAPKQFKIVLDSKDRDIFLTTVLEVTSRIVTDETGKPIPTLLEVVERSESVSGNELELVAQSYDYDGKYGYFMENTANDYDSATDLEKAEGAYFADEDGVIFTDEPYTFI